MNRVDVIICGSDVIKCGSDGDYSAFKELGMEFTIRNSALPAYNT